MTADAAVLVKDTFFLGGAWVPATGRAPIPVINPATEEQIASVPAGAPEDVDRAVDAARAAFKGWAATPADERARLLAAAADALEARTDEIARQISSEMGTPLSFSVAVQVGNPVRVLRSYAEVLGTYSFEEQIANSLVVKEPIGVVGAITPWNYPLHQVVAKVAAALAAGCTVVLKPSEVAPLSSYALAEVFEQIGLPAGVFNLVTGLGPIVGERIAEHPDVDMVSFTGSTAAGKRVMAVAAGTVKKVSLELGGKSAFVILDDADLGKAVKVGMANCFINGGQTCTAWTRMLVPASKYDEVLDLVRDNAGKYPVGAPDAEGTRIGPLANANQYKKVVGYIEQAIADGATLVVGGPDRPEGLDRGYYVKPTVLGGVKPGSRVEQEEVFGPVLAVIPYDDEDEAVEIANGTPYGLAGGVFSGDQERAVAVARRLRTGMVDVNGGRFNLLAPFGGYKQSGNGREMGEYGLEEFLEIKSLQL
ncbi:MAG: aldehyde dehydrogenase [Actinomycetota bacterium]|jgi:acyl-CoA reductase-like NAD-dependent aldehyde dehydrogenase|nr:aldehyde dehydrogenase [Actinomycetota bacterium]